MNLNLASGGTVDVSDVAFGKEFNEPLVHQVVTAFLFGARQGSKAQKTRSEVRGGGKKPWKQKGGGRARAGTIRSPIWRTGGVTFAAKPQEHSQKVNKKMYRGAMRCIISELIRQDRLIVVEDFSVEKPKTKDLLVKLKSFGSEKALIVVESVDENLYLSSRNLPYVSAVDVPAVDPISLVGAEKVIMTVGALKVFEGMLS